MSSVVVPEVDGGTMLPGLAIPVRDIFAPLDERLLTVTASPAPHP